MTNLEAADLLDNLIGMVSDNRDSDYDEALSMGRDLLEQEPKTGHWKPRVYLDDTRYGYTCDNCNEWVRDKSDYCPNCGAKMVEPQESEVEE